MKRKLIASGDTGKIFDALIDPFRPCMITDGMIDRTWECIIAVANHMRQRADSGLENDIWKYHMENEGTLIWINKDCHGVMGLIWNALKLKAFERYGNEGMGGELVVNLDDLYDLLYTAFDYLVGLEDEKEDE
ncbi:MAG: hypothetical protein IJZ96_09140 [Lachnospiraceae bacterium]|nr:hypothetical protein [Lachnospiraceae bacterium]